MSNIATIDRIEPRKKSVTIDMADRYGMEPDAFEATLRATVVPANSSREQFAAFLLVAKEYKLNPLLKEIYAFPTRAGGIQPIVGVDGWANLINSHPSFNGMDFIDAMNDSGDLVSITCKMFRKDRDHAVTATEYLEECKRNTEPWKQWPRRMLRHKAMIQAARYAFGFAGIVDPDEAERINTEFDPPPRQPLLGRMNASAAPGFSPTHVDNELTPPQSSLAPSPTSPPETTPASDVPLSDAGTIPAEGNGAIDPPPAAAPAQLSVLPEGWAKGYADALKRAAKKESLPKFAKEFWKQHGGWEVHKDGPDGSTASAIYSAFSEHFGETETINVMLHELGAD